MTRVVTSTAVDLLDNSGGVQLRVDADSRQRENGDDEYVRIKVGATVVAWLDLAELRTFSEQLELLADALEAVEG